MVARSEMRLFENSSPEKEEPGADKFVSGGLNMMCWRFRYNLGFFEGFSKVALRPL
jgi:hypothetical protein